MIGWRIQCSRRISNSVTEHRFRKWRERSNVIHLERICRILWSCRCLTNRYSGNDFEDLVKHWIVHRMMFSLSFFKWVFYVESNGKNMGKIGKLISRWEFPVCFRHWFCCARISLICDGWSGVVTNSILHCSSRLLWRFCKMKGAFFCIECEERIEFSIRRDNF